MRNPLAFAPPKWSGKGELDPRDRTASSSPCPGATAASPETSSSLPEEPYTRYHLAQQDIHAIKTKYKTIDARVGNIHNQRVQCGQGVWYRGEDEDLGVLCVVRSINKFDNLQKMLEDIPFQKIFPEVVEHKDALKKLRSLLGKQPSSCVLAWELEVVAHGKPGHWKTCEEADSKNFRLSTSASGVTVYRPINPHSPTYSYTARRLDQTHINAIKAGEKIVDVRLNSALNACIQEGSNVWYRGRLDGLGVLCSVTGIFPFSDFSQMLQRISHKLVYPQSKTKAGACATFRKVCSENEQRRFGVLACYLKPIAYGKPDHWQKIRATLK